MATHFMIFFAIARDNPSACSRIEERATTKRFSPIRDVRESHANLTTALFHRMA
jgi:hypothetical protein